jgi:hypothetical protein
MPDNISIVIDTNLLSTCLFEKGSNDLSIGAIDITYYLQILSNHPDVKIILATDPHLHPLVASSGHTQPQPLLDFFKKLGIKHASIIYRTKQPTSMIARYSFVKIIEEHYQCSPKNTYILSSTLDIMHPNYVNGFNTIHFPLSMHDEITDKVSSVLKKALTQISDSISPQQTINHNIYRNIHRIKNPYDTFAKTPSTLPQHTTTQCSSSSHHTQDNVSITKNSSSKWKPKTNNVTPITPPVITVTPVLDENNISEPQQLVAKLN